MVAVVTLAVGAVVSVVELSVVVLSVVVVVVSEVLELLECSSFSPQEMMVRLKHEIRKMYKIFSIFFSRRLAPSIYIIILSTSLLQEKLQE